MTFYDPKSTDEMKEIIQLCQKNAEEQFKVQVQLTDIYSTCGAILQQKVAEFVQNTFGDLTPLNLVGVMQTIEGMMKPVQEEKSKIIISDGGPPPKAEEVAAEVLGLPKVGKGKGSR